MKKKTFFVVTLVIAIMTTTSSITFAQEDSSFDLRTTEICKQISEGASINPKLNVAVIEFSSLNGKPTDFSRFLCEELTTKLFQTKKFNIVERSQIDKIAKEQKLQLDGPIDEESIKKLGKLIGVDAILTGTITDLQSIIRINARLISATSGSLHSATSVNLIKDELVESLLKASSAPVKTIQVQAQGQQQKSKPENSNEIFPSTPSKDFTDGLTFELRRLVKGNEGRVYCEVLITSLAEDITASIGNSSSSATTRIVSTSGKSYQLYGVQIDSGRSTGRVINYKFLSGVPTLVTFVFDKAADDFSSFYLFNVHVAVGKDNRNGSEVRLKIQEN